MNPAPDSILSAPVATKFWGLVSTSGQAECWNWKRCTSNGYGQVHFRGHGMLKAHKLAFILEGGLLTAERDCVCHRCDNRLCCNPAHHFAGSKRHNSEDMVAKGRSAVGPKHGLVKHPAKRPRGITHGNAVLTDDQVRDIRDIYSAGSIGQKALGIKFGVSQSRIHMIVRRKQWKHVK